MKPFLTLTALLLAAGVHAVEMRSEVAPMPAKATEGGLYRMTREEFDKTMIAFRNQAIAKYPDQSIPPAKPEAIEAWRDLRFGMFIHWGPVSLTEREVGWSRGAPTPIEEYDSLYKRFNPIKFNADEWAATAKAAGIKYAVLVAKHHDGFSLWPTKLSDYNIMAGPFKRDIVREAADAFRKQGIKFGIYYSQVDWYHPDFPLTSPGGKTRRGTYDLDAYEEFALGQMRELIENYGPLLTIWNDLPHEAYWNRGTPIVRMARALQPDILMNNRNGSLGDYGTAEQKIGTFNQKPWESCMTISKRGCWAWGGPKDGVKDLATCLGFLIRAAGGDGNMLLNIGPTPEGEIAPEQRGVLLKMGEWLATHGESIYGTRGGPWKPSDACVSTRKGNTVYLHISKWEGEAVSLPALPAKILKSEILGGGRAEVVQDARGVRVTVAKAEQQPIVTTIKLELDSAASRIAPIDIVPATPSPVTPTPKPQKKQKEGEAVNVGDLLGH